MPSLALMIISSVLLSCQALTSENSSFLMSLLTSDVEVTYDDVGLCKAFRVPANASFDIVEFLPHPILDMYHHLNVYLCAQPGIQQNLPLDQLVWNCFGKNFQPDLPRGNICQAQEIPMFATFDMGTNALKLPDGYGYRAGGDTGLNYVVLGTHYPSVKALKNGRTGHSELTLRLVPRDSNKKTKRVGLFNLSAWALIPPKSVTTMNGSYYYDQPIPMTPIALLTHTHSRGMDFEFWRTRVNGQRELMWKQDPSRAKHFIVPPHPLSAISDGDTLTVRCTFNNTSNALLVVDFDEMCNIIIIYAVDGDQLIPTPDIYTVRKIDADLFQQYVPSWKIVRT